MSSDCKTINSEEPSYELRNAPRRAGDGVGPLAVTSARRSAFLPQVPDMEELNLAKAAIQGFYAIAAPAGTPMSVVDRLVKEVDAIMSTPESKAKCAELSLEAVSMGPDGLRAVMSAELACYRELSKRLEISID